MKSYQHINKCRICKSTDLQKTIDLGKTPLANAFLSESQLTDKETYYPLRTYFCNKCHLLQLGDIVPPEILFKDYVYVSSTSPVFIRHFTDFTEKILHRFKLNNKSLVIDIGSNDGILLKPFLKKNLRVLGIEPAANIAKIAQKKGIETITRFFSIMLARQVSHKYGLADLITATNVFAHINDINEVAEGIKIMLSTDGVFIIEAPYLINFLKQNLFDTIYHEHLSYYALSPLIFFFKLHQMYVFDAEIVDSHGGSLRIYMAKEGAKYKINSSIQKFISLEKHWKLDKKSTYLNFAVKINRTKIALIDLLKKIKSQNKVIAGFGAPAKGNTLLNYFGIGCRILDYIVDDSVYKQGLYTPGTHIPIVSPERLVNHPPDYLIILAWNFADAIMKRFTSLHKQGMKYILPVPRPCIIYIIFILMDSFWV